MSRFDYIEYDEKAKEIQATFKAAFQVLESCIGVLQPGRASVFAMTKLEESYMWAGKAIRDEQLYREASKK